MGEATVSKYPHFIMLIANYICSKDAWYHLQFQKIEEEIHVACTCPDGIRSKCIHQLYFQVYGIGKMIAGADETGKSPWVGWPGCSLNRF